MTEYLLEFETRTRGITYRQEIAWTAANSQQAIREVRRDIKRRHKRDKLQTFSVICTSCEAMS